MAKGQNLARGYGSIFAGHARIHAIEPTQYGRFSRNWQDEQALDVLIDKLEAGQLCHKQALMQARKIEATTSYNLEI